MIKSKQGSKSDYEDAINLLSMWLERYHKEKVVILINEYDVHDVPAMEGYMNHIYDEIIKFMREVFSNVLKGNNSLTQISNSFCHFRSEEFLVGLG